MGIKRTSSANESNSNDDDGDNNTSTTSIDDDDNSDSITDKITIIIKAMKRIMNNNVCNF